MVIRGHDRDDQDPFPTLAYLRVERLNTPQYEDASAVFVSPDIFLTAAHVFHSPDKTKRVKELEVSLHEPATGQELYFEEHRELEFNEVMEKRFRIHPEYSKGLNDVAVFKVDTPVQTFASVLTGETMKSDEFKSVFAGVAGWGLMIRSGRIDKPSGAQFAPQFVAEFAADIEDEADQYYRPDTDTPTLLSVIENGLFYVSNISDGKRQGPCPGDSGGGVFLGLPEAAVSEPNLPMPSHALLGIVSHSSLPPPHNGATNPERLDHYSRTDLSVACTNLILYKDWIDAAIGELGGKPITYM
ncbi:MAG: trypsin-like serine protease [Pseudomonadota bacterium]